MTHHIDYVPNDIVGAWNQLIYPNREIIYLGRLASSRLGEVVLPQNRIKIVAGGNRNGAGTYYNCGANYLPLPISFLDKPESDFGDRGVSLLLFESRFGGKSHL